jgi:hypothetical protein
MLADNVSAAIGSALILLPLLALVALWAWALVDTLRYPTTTAGPGGSSPTRSRSRPRS